MGRQCNCRDYCVLKCNLGTRRKAGLVCILCTIAIVSIFENGCSDKRPVPTERLRLLREGVTTDAPYAELIILPYRSLNDKKGNAFAGVRFLHDHFDRREFPSFARDVDPAWGANDTCLVWMLDAKPESVSIAGHRIILEHVTRTKGVWFGWYAGIRDKHIDQIQSQIDDRIEFGKWERPNDK